jgi:hypothetical protein
MNHRTSVIPSARQQAGTPNSFLHPIMSVSGPSDELTYTEGGNDPALVTDLAAS